MSEGPTTATVAPDALERADDRASHEQSREADRLIVLIPIYNDWDAVGLLLPDLDRALSGAGLAADVLLVDDGSTTDAPEAAPDDSRGGVPRQRSEPTHGVGRVNVLSLRRNLGHQRAIAVGLAFIEANLPCRAVVVMDGDGEDDPSDVPRLVQRMAETGDRSIVFAERTRRSESLLFRIGYFLYRHIHRALTGIRVRVGNFSVVPRVQLRRLVVVSDLWNHFAAAVFRARLRFETVPCERAHRLSGTPKMNLVSLTGHGLSAMSVFGDRIGTRMLIASSLLILVSAVAIVGLGVAAVANGASLSGWGAYGAGLLVMVLLQALLFSLVFVFIILASRNTSGFIPARDHVFFVEGLQTSSLAPARQG